MNLKGLMLTSAILFSNGVSDNTLNINPYINDYYMNINTTTSSNSSYDEFIIYNENHDNTLYNVYLSFDNGVFTLNASSDYGLDGNNYIFVRADELFNSYILNDNPLPSNRGFYCYLYGNSYDYLGISYFTVDSSSNSSTDHFLYFDTERLPVQLGDINNSPQFFYLNNESILQWCKQVLIEYNNSLTNSIFTVLGETISSYVSSITTMFNELMLLFYADNKLTYLSQLLLVGIGIGITKWGMNFVKDRVRL